MPDRKVSPTDSVSPRRDPVWLIVTSHWLAMLGLGLVVTAIITWLFVLPLQVRGQAENPYIGLFSFVAVPFVLLLGIVLLFIGVYLGRRRARARLAAGLIEKKKARTRLLTFLGILTAANLLVGTQGTYRAVHHMESVQFCGQTCHVMKPEFTAHPISAHAQVTCVECHVAPGAVGWVESKATGTRQLVETIFDTHPRPIPSALETDRLVPARQTCEQCHWRDKPGAIRLKVVTKFASDEENTPSQTVLTLHVGGSRMGGIHGKHFGPGVEIRYAAVDKKRQEIAWVEYSNSETKQTHTYLADGKTADDVKDLKQHVMQCVDCHNRPAHPFWLPERALDLAMGLGVIPVTLPYVKRQGLEVIRAEYATTEEATRRIPEALTAFYRDNYPQVLAERGDEIEAASRGLVAVYTRNVFPELDVTWGTYPNNIGHEDFPGCFRCHDEAHRTPDGRTITQDCATCHEASAVEETDPEVLKTLGLTDALIGMQRR